MGKKPRKERYRKGNVTKAEGKEVEVKAKEGNTRKVKEKCRGKVRKTRDRQDIRSRLGQFTGFSVLFSNRFFRFSF